MHSIKMSSQFTESITSHACIFIIFSDYKMKYNTGTVKINSLFKACIIFHFQMINIIPGNVYVTIFY